MDLLPLEEVQRRLRVVGQSYAGVRPIEVARVVGSLDRSRDFDRSFRPRRAASSQRLDSLRNAFPDGDMPPIEAYEVGGAYFVSDGHHRVALALERSWEYIDAEATRLETNLGIGPEVDVRQLVHTQEVAGDWYDTVYAPGVAALRREALPDVYRYKTDADLFLWVYQRRRALRVLTPDADFDSAGPRRPGPEGRPALPQTVPAREVHAAAAPRRPARLLRRPRGLSRWGCPGPCRRGSRAARRGTRTPALHLRPEARRPRSHRCAR